MRLIVMFVFCLKWILNFFVLQFYEDGIMFVIIFMLFFCIENFVRM